MRRGGYAAHADSTAAVNISRRAAVMLPNVPEANGAAPASLALPRTSPTLKRRVHDLTRDLSILPVEIIAPPRTAGMPPPGCTDAPTRHNHGRLRSL